jgi:protoporphyrinogen oxidase
MPAYPLALAACEDLEFNYGRYAQTATDHPEPQVRVAIIGGGLAGLVGALDLAEGGADVVLLEAADRFGGQIRTTRERGFLVEEGADGFTSAQGNLLAFCHALQLGGEIVTPESLPWLVLEQPGDLGRARLATGTHPAGPELTLAGGMGSLVRALTRRLERQADLRVGNAAVAVTRTPPGWTVYPELGSALVVDAVLLALPARPAAWLIHPLSHEASGALSLLPTRAIVTVSMAYPLTGVGHPLSAAGFIVHRDPAADGIETCAFVSSSFPRRAPADWVLVRAVVRPGRGELAATTDEGWTEIVHAALVPSLGLSGTPQAVWVARWADAATTVTDQTAGRVAEARTALRASGRIELAGASYEGGGLEGAIRSGRIAAQRLLAG